MSYGHVLCHTAHELACTCPVTITKRVMSRAATVVCTGLPAVRHWRQR
jgi:hypothetical protein